MNLSNYMIQNFAYTHVVKGYADSRTGIPQDTLSQTWLQLSQKSLEDISHVGLYNCYSRFRFFFGGHVKFQVKSQENRGTEIRISIFPPKQSTHP